MRTGLVLFAGTLLTVSTNLFAQLNPIAVTGFTQDAVAEGPPNSLATTTMQVDGGSSNKVIYTQAFRAFAGIGGGGIPDNGTLISGADTYQMAPYTGNNALYIYRNETASLALVTPASYARVRVLCFSTEGASSLNITLNFTDGSSFQYLTNYSLPDWFNGGNTVLAGIGRCDRSVGPTYNADAYPSNPRMYFIDIPVRCSDLPKQLQSVTFANVSTFPNNAPFPNTVLLALSGIGYSQNIIDVITPSDCAGPNGSIALTVTGSSSPYSYAWNTNPVQNGATATGLAPGNYSCTITDASGCTTTYNGTVALNNNAAITATASPMAVCPGNASQLTANVTTGNMTTFTWTPGNLNGQSVSVTPGATTQYTVNATNAIGCTASAQVTVSVNAVPAPIPANNVTVCSGANAVLQVQNPQPGETYNWYSAASGGPILFTGTSYTVNNVTANATYYVETVNASNCSSGTRTPFTITVSQPAAATAAPVTVCSGANATLQVQNPQTGFTYNWYATAAGPVLATGTSYTANNVTANTTYYLETISDLGCPAATRTPVNVSIYQQLAQPIVTVSNVSFSSITFSWSPVPGATGYEISVNGSGSYQPPSSGATGTTHTINGLPGNTTVTLEVRALGTPSCVNSVLSAPVSGTTLSSKEIFVPNVFTPNGDGRNDVLMVYGNYMASMRFSIFNQWGELIFVSENIGTGWNGTHKGKLQPVGVYAYTLKVVLQDGTVITKKGSVNLIR
jgi:gliding motility-associated-like protein